MAQYNEPLAEGVIRGLRLTMIPHCAAPGNSPLSYHSASHFLVSFSCGGCRKNTLHLQATNRKVRSNFNTI
jgi:hypothetical protein